MLPLPPLVSTTDRWRTAVAAGAAHCHGSDSCTSVVASRSSDRSAADFPVGCSSGPHRCGPRSVQEVGPTTRWFRHRSRNSRIERRRDTPGCSARGGSRPTPRRIRANFPNSSSAGLPPDMRYRSRSSDCASKALPHSRDTVSRARRYDRPPTRSRRRIERTLSPLSGLN
jgi:hypothetical protein